ncbi:MAG: thioredoxin domain-containing protein, partial [Blastocatellia bacterium]|nr:thioredoxin domain-containing protein [Blastocatellia bacterium]
MRFNRPAEEISRILAESRASLLAERGKRPRPHLDDKILVSWNGLMISALARAASVLGDETYLRASEKSAEFILNKLYDSKEKRLLRRYRDGEARYEADLEDYAFFTMGLLDLYEAALDTRWLRQAIELTERQNALFYDEKQGGFFDTTGKDESLLIRTKDDYDGAEPTGNSIAAMNLLRLAQMTDNKKWGEMADRALAFFGKRLDELPEAMPQMLAVLDYHLDKPKEIVIAGHPGREDTEKMLHEVHARYIPNKIILFADGGPGQEFLGRYLPFIQSMKMRGDKATAYICQNYACKLPTADLGVMAKLLEEKSRK